MVGRCPAILAFVRHSYFYHADFKPTYFFKRSQFGIYADESLAQSFEYQLLGFDDDHFGKFLAL